VNKTINKRIVESKHSLTANQYSAGVSHMFSVLKDILPSKL